MAFQISRTDQATGTVRPTAYVRIDDAIVSLQNSTVELVLNTYDSAQAAADGKAPVLPAEHIVLTGTEVGALRGGFRAQLYALLKHRPAYQDAVDV